MKLSPNKMRELANRINEEVFSGVLDINELVFRNKKTEKQNVRAWFYYDDNSGFYNITIIESEHNSEYDIFHSLAHELIHYWQDSIAETTMGHNCISFRYWKRKVCTTYGFKYRRWF